MVSLGKGDGFYYQVVIFLALALKERRKHRLTLWASLFFGAFSVLFTDLFATFTPYYVFSNLFTNMSLVEIQENFFLNFAILCDDLSFFSLCQLSIKFGY